MTRYRGSRGDDSLSGTDTRDLLRGLAGNDVLVGNLGNDSLQGGDGYDLLIGDAVNDSFSTGNDTLSGGDGNDLLSGGSGDDILLGGDGDDILFGGTVANASLVGTRFDTALYTGGAGDDAFDGGAGIDQAYLAYSDKTVGISVDLSDPNAVSQITEAGVAIGSITAVESVVFYGSSGDDHVIGGAGNDILMGYLGNDYLSGGGGDDWFEVGGGNDVFDGGEGSDLVRAFYFGASLDIAFDLSKQNRAQETGLGRETLTSIEMIYVENSSGGSTALKGQAGANSLTANGAGDIAIDGYGGDDYVRGNVTGGGGVTMSLSGGDGADYVSGVVQAGGRTTLSLSGGGGDDVLGAFGSSRYSDIARINGGTGNDQIFVNGIGTAIIDAGAGRDEVTIDPLGGNYFVSLGAGSDVLALGYPAGQNTVSTIRVRDFATGTNGDQLSFASWIQGGGLTGLASGANPFIDGHLRFVQSGSNAILQVDRDGGGDNWSTLITFNDTDAAFFIPANVGGYALVEGIVLTGTDDGEQIDGGAGDDVLIGAGGNDTLNGSFASDVLYGDLADGTAGPAGNDVLNGGDDRDFVIGGRGNDRLSGGAGDDILIAGVAYGARFYSPTSFTYRNVSTIDAGVDRIDGGDGLDRAVFAYARTGGVSVDASDPTKVAQVHFGDKVIGTVINVEQLFIRTDAGTGDDHIVTGAGNDSIFTGQGDDYVSAGAGFDHIDGGSGNDTIDGGADTDEVAYVVRSSALTVDLSRQGVGQDTGDGGADTLISIEQLFAETHGQAVALTGDGGPNGLFVYRVSDSGALGDVHLAGGDGQDSLDVETDSFVGAQATTVVLDGGAGDDYITVAYYDPTSNLDTVQAFGGDGADTILLTGVGAATIDAGAGFDKVAIDMPILATRVSLGSGADTLTIFGNATDHVVRDALHITDFETGAAGDVLSLGEWLTSGVLTGYDPGTNPFASGYLTLHQRGGSVQVLVDRDGGADDFRVLLTFEHTQADAFTAENFAGFSPSANNAAAIFEAAPTADAIAATLSGSHIFPIDVPSAIDAWP